MSSRDARVLCLIQPEDGGSTWVTALAAHFDCTCVNSTEAALTQAAAAGPFAVAVAAASGAGGGGAFLRGVREHWPDTVGVIISGSDHLDEAIAALHAGDAYRLVRAPCADEVLVKAVREACAYFELVRDERALREQLARTNAQLDDKIRDLDEANELLEYWVEFSPAVLYSMSCDHGVLHASYISKNFHRLTGFERTAAVIDPSFWSDLMHPEDRPHYDQVLGDLVTADGVHAVLEYRIRHRDGTYLTVVDSMRAVRDANGETIEVVGAWMDVSARAGSSQHAAGGGGARQ